MINKNYEVEVIGTNRNGTDRRDETLCQYKGITDRHCEPVINRISEGNGKKGNERELVHFLMSDPLILHI